jgi:phosphoribosylglycinamide formyltransferase-1
MSVPPLRIGAMISGSGRTVENLATRIRRDGIPAEIVAVIAHREGIPGVARCREAGLPVAIVPAAPPETLADRIDATLADAGVELVCLCGYLRRFRVSPRWSGRAINIHPSLLPAFGGQGFHGMHVHRAVLERGCTVSGCTVHLVDDEYDHGRVLLQEAVPVLPDDSPESLAARVFAAECRTLPEAIRRIGSGLLA